MTRVFPEHPCENPQCQNTTTNRRYCSRPCARNVTWRVMRSFLTPESAKKRHKSWNERDPEGYRLHQSVAGIAGGKIGGVKVHELYPDMARSNGLRTGSVNIRKTSHKTRVRLGKQIPYEARVRAGKKGGKINGPKNIKKALEARSPTNLENRLFSLIMYYKLPFTFTGSGGIKRIGKKFPDFMHNKNITIEIANKNNKKYISGWPSKESYEHFCTGNYSPIGWKCINLWEDQTDEQMLSIIKQEVIKE